ncbi:MAG: hypothetical protein C4K58_06955 [Flavobacteriaceae bacterium]|nr:MAG: hypothetical protein C4K58_06955 [Flavobacteriaceae bacterium]
MPREARLYAYQNNGRNKTITIDADIIVKNNAGQIVPTMTRKAMPYGKPWVISQDLILERDPENNWQPIPNPEPEAPEPPIEERGIFYKKPTYYPHLMTPGYDYLAPLMESGMTPAQMFPLYVGVIDAEGGFDQ